ncbi:MAG: cytochrome o ubiquinol oxidase subunit III [Chlamydiales bacterium]
MTQQTVTFPDPHQDIFSKTTLGFWIYLMTDCLIFATLFVTYGVLHKGTFGGPGPAQLFSLSLSFTETMVLLFSSVVGGFAMLAMRSGQMKKFYLYFIITFLLGLSFVVLEVHEFMSFVYEGNSWERSAFLSSFFTLVGTHGLHVSIGLLWMLVLMIQIAVLGVTTTTFRRLVCFNMFWHFLDLVWIFIFSFVYLLGEFV